VMGDYVVQFPRDPGALLEHRPRTCSPHCGFSSRAR
jgi:hypothetical protein